MKKILSVALILCFALTLSAFCLTGCSLFKSVSIDEAKANLENAGYEVTVMSGHDYVESDQNPYPFLMEFELEGYLYAVKGEDVIHLYFFTSVDNASDNYDFMNEYSDLTRGQSNAVIYMATKQAKADAGV